MPALQLTLHANILRLQKHSLSKMGKNLIQRGGTISVIQEGVPFLHKFAMSALNEVLLDVNFDQLSTPWDAQSPKLPEQGFTVLIKCGIRLKGDKRDCRINDGWKTSPDYSGISSSWKHCKTMNFTKLANSLIISLEISARGIPGDVAQLRPRRAGCVWKQDQSHYLGL